MEKKLGPYVGITGFMSCAEVHEALAMVPWGSPEGSMRRLMVGILMSSKTLAGQTNKWPGRYPKKEAVADIFIDDERALNLIHYNTDDPLTLCKQLREITSLAGPYLDGFQLNITWPSMSQVEDYATIHPDKFLLLQVGRKAMAECGSMERFEEFVGAYLPFLDAILIDPSGGKGEPLDAAKGAEYLRAIPACWSMGIGIAGGLGPGTLNLIRPLIPEFPNLSIDAEGRLRTPKPEDALNLAAMRRYLIEAYSAFEKVDCV